MSSKIVDDICSDITVQMHKVQSQFPITPYDSYLLEARKHLQDAREHLRAYQRVALRSK